MRTRVALGLIVAAFAINGCSSDTKATDQGIKTDVTKQDGNKPPPEVICKTDGSDCKDHVLSRLILPTKDADAQKYGLEFGGKKYNALGSILGALSAMVTSLSIQDSVDSAVNGGTTVVLIRVQAANFANDPKAAGQAWVGAKADCCPTAAGDKVKCAAESLTTCFNPTTPFTFTVDAKSPTDATMSGKIASNAINFTANSLKLSLPLTTAGVVELTLKNVQVKGTLVGNTIKDGILAGAIGKNEVDNNLIPTVAKMLNTTLQDPTVDQKTKDPIIQLFDNNPKDGTITTKEVAENAIIKTFLAGDVDVDGDKVMDLSLGIGFDGVRVVIKK